MTILDRMQVINAKRMQQKEEMKIKIYIRRYLLRNN